MKITTKKNIFNKHRTAVCLFLFLILYSVIVPAGGSLWRNGAAVYTFHAVDFSMGFCTRILPGAIYRLLTGGAYTQRAVDIYETVLIVLFFAVIAVFCEKLAEHTEREDRKALFVILFFFLTGPFTFSLFVKKTGMLDVYWVYFSVLILMLLSKKKFVWFAVPLFAALILVHYASAITYIPVLLLIFVYKALRTNDKEEKKTLLAAAVCSFLLSVGLFAYFLINERNNLTYTMNELAQILLSRNVGPDPDMYYDFVFYRDFADPEFKRQYIEITHFDMFADAAASSGPLSFAYVIKQQVLSTFGSIKAMYDFKGNAPAYIAVIPVIAVLFGFIFHMTRREKKLLNKLVFLCSPLFFVVSFFGGGFLSTDLNRWMTHATICLFVFALYVFHSQEKDAAAYFGRLVSYCPSGALVFFWIVYSSLSVDPYCG